MPGTAINTDIHSMKNRLKSRLLLCGAFFLLLMAEFGFSEEKVHVIKEGETIYSIARQYGVQPQDVLDHNKISDPRTVRAGTKIRIPGPNNTGTVSSPVSNPYGEYQVERNDTLYSLARRYGIPLPDLLDMNGFSPDYVIKVGEKIRVPAQKPAITGTSGASGKTPTASGQSSTASGQSSTPSAQTGGDRVVVVPNGSPPVRIDPSIRWPVKPKEITYITGRLYGVQVTGETREGVKSLTAGTVVSAGPYRGFGKVAIVQSAGGYLYVYGGCETLSVKEGDKVFPGTELGKLGIDSKSAKSQLFFFVYRGNTSIDPAKAPRA